MPIQIANESNNSGGGGGAGNEIKVKIAYSGEVMITYIDEAITYDGLCREIREICRFGQEQVGFIERKNLAIDKLLTYWLFVVGVFLQDFTMKWVDEENDPCTIQSDLELDEAIRLYEVNRDSELVIHGKGSGGRWKKICPCAAALDNIGEDDAFLEGRIDVELCFLKSVFIQCLVFF